MPELSQRIMEDIYAALTQEITDGDIREAVLSLEGMNDYLKCLANAMPDSSIGKRSVVKVKHIIDQLVDYGKEAHYIKEDEPEELDFSSGQ